MAVVERYNCYWRDLFFTAMIVGVRAKRDAEHYFLCLKWEWHDLTLSFKTRVWTGSKAVCVMYILIHRGKNKCMNETSKKHQSHTTPCIEWHIMSKTQKTFHLKSNLHLTHQKNKAKAFLLLRPRRQPSKDHCLVYPRGMGSPFRPRGDNSNLPGWEKHLIYKFVAARCVLMTCLRQASITEMWWTEIFY